jgi:dTDP-4-amino-4,6-dideoxygalactose transaminase
MSEINAALGLSVIKYMDDIIKHRNHLFNNYQTKIKTTRIKKINLRNNCTWNYSYYPVIFENENDLLLAEKKFNENQIFPRRYFYPSLNKLPYLENKKMPISEDISKRILCLPIYPNLEQLDQNRIIDILND